MIQKDKPFPALFSPIPFPFYYNFTWYFYVLVFQKHAFLYLPLISHIMLFDRSWHNNSGWPQCSSLDRPSKQDKRWRKFTVRLHHEPNRPKQRALYREAYAFPAVCGNFFKRDGCHSSSQRKSEQTQKKQKNASCLISSQGSGIRNQQQETTQILGDCTIHSWMTTISKKSGGK